jgi:hypothetical protein
MGKIAYRWYVVNNQETCIMSIVELVDGWFSCEEEVQKHLKGKYNFRECLFCVRPIKESETPVYLLPKYDNHNEYVRELLND